jgi:hypothetical protein
MSVRKRIQQLQQITTEDKACNFSDKVDVSITQKPDEEEVLARATANVSLSGNRKGTGQKPFEILQLLANAHQQITKMSMFRELTSDKNITGK